ncbi:hypothetical protein EV127DRAFT_404858 [Xylaria flabelliformis]|nr:hypothetical protein EV127DRAFT_404858 [Xylaria flabelliformis]
MCGSNSIKTVEGVKVQTLLNNPSRHIPWCFEARVAFVRHCVQHRLNFTTLKFKRIDDLLTSIRCNYMNMQFIAATYQRIVTAVTAALKKLVCLKLVARIGDDIFYPDTLIQGILDRSWMGDLKKFKPVSSADNKTASPMTSLALAATDPALDSASEPSTPTYQGTSSHSRAHTALDSASSDHRETYEDSTLYTRAHPTSALRDHRKTYEDFDSCSQARLVPYSPTSPRRYW